VPPATTLPPADDRLFCFEYMIILCGPKDTFLAPLRPCRFLAPLLPDIRMTAAEIEILRLLVLLLDVQLCSHAVKAHSSELASLCYPSTKG